MRTCPGAPPPVGCQPPPSRRAWARRLRPLISRRRALTRCWHSLLHTPSSLHLHACRKYGFPASQVLAKLKKIVPEAKEMIGRAAQGTGSSYPSSIAKVGSSLPCFSQQHPPAAASAVNVHAGTFVGFTSFMGPTCMSHIIWVACMHLLSAWVAASQELETVESEVEAQIQAASNGQGDPSNLKSFLSGVEQQVNALKAIAGFD